MFLVVIIHLAAKLQCPVIDAPLKFLDQDPADVGMAVLGEAYETDERLILKASNSPDPLAGIKGDDAPEFSLNVCRPPVSSAALVATDEGRDRKRRTPFELCR